GKGRRRYISVIRLREAKVMRWLEDRVVLDEAVDASRRSFGVRPFVGPTWPTAERCSWTFRTLPREFSSFKRHGAANGLWPLSRTRFCPSRLATALPVFPGSAARRTGLWRPVGTRSRGRVDGRARHARRRPLCVNPSPIP